MEYAIAIFVGIWIAGAGILSYVRVKKDYSGVNDEEKKNR